MRYAGDAPCGGFDFADEVDGAAYGNVAVLHVAFKHSLAQIGEGARLAEVLGIEGAAELSESAFSSEGLAVSLNRTAGGKAKATVTPEGAAASFFLRVKVR